MRPSRFLSISIALAFAAPCGLVHAGDPLTAEALFRAGRAAAQRGEYREACDKFTESYRLDKAPGTLLNLGDCKEHLGLYASAWVHYHEASDQLVGDDRIAIAKARLEAIEPRLSWLTVALAPGAPADSTVRRDETDLGPASLGTKLPVDAGRHVVIVEARGRTKGTFAVDIREAETKSIAVAPGPPIGVSDNPPSASSPLKPIGVAVAAIGLAGVGVGAVTGAMTVHRKSIVDQECEQGLCTKAGLDAAASGRSLSTISTVTFIAGGAALAGGIVLFLAAPDAKKATAITLTPSSIRASVSF